MRYFRNAKFTVILSDKSQLPVHDVVIHPQFDDYRHDIALLKVSAITSFAPVCLPITYDTQNESFKGIRCIASGWGRSERYGEVKEDLHEVELKVVDNRHCKTMYGIKYNIQIQDYHLCAGPIMSGGKGTCVGDSGGPLHCNMADGKWYLAGMISFGSGCAKPGFPDVFMRLTSYSQWIESVIIQGI